MITRINYCLIILIVTINVPLDVLSQPEGYPENIPLTQHSDHTFELYENGDTLKLFKWINEQTYESYCFYPNGDTMVFVTETCIQNRCEKTVLSFFENGSIKGKHHRLRNDIQNEFTESILFNQLGDTVAYEYTYRDTIEGLNIKQHIGYFDTLIFKTKWKNGRIYDIVNKDFIFVNDNFDLISESEWLSTHTTNMCIEEFGKELIIAGRKIKYYCCCSTFKRRKHNRWRRKMFKKYKTGEYP